MGQKVHPNGLRVGVIKDWESKWYADSKNYSDYLVEDYKIRKYVKQKLLASGISKIEIERTAKFVKINVYTAKPGLVIGKGGNLAEDRKRLGPTQPSLLELRSVAKIFLENLMTGKPISCLSRVQN